MAWSPTLAKIYVLPPRLRGGESLELSYGILERIWLLHVVTIMHMQICNRCCVNGSTDFAHWIETFEAGRVSIIY
jgi:hypothetical protein